MGIVFATTITLLLVPTITVIFEDIRVGLCKLYDRPIDRGYEQTGELADVADSLNQLAEEIGSSRTGLVLLLG